MGQQQLLLVILVTIIVGIATVVAINVFGSSAENANLDAVRQDLLAAATSSQGWYIKPQMLGGGGQSFENLTLEDLGIPFDRTDVANVAPYTTVTNANGTYVLTPPAADSDAFEITATPNNWSGTVLLEVNQLGTTPAERVSIVETAI